MISSTQIKPMTIAIGSDHAGLLLKEQFKKWLISHGYSVIDVGTNNSMRTDYPDYTQKLAKLLQNRKADRGLVCCGSGVGVTIGMNRFFGIRALRCQKSDQALIKLAREHNDINVLAFGQKFITFSDAIPLIEIFLATKPLDDHHYRRRNQKLDQN